MRVFVTGGSGFVGGHLISALVARGDEVHARARSEKAAGVVRGFGAVPAPGELGALRAEAIAGADAVVHAAAFVEECVPSRIARPAARMIEGVWRTVGVKRAPPMTRFAIDMMSSTVTVRTDRARRELGYAPVIGVEEGLSRLTDEGTRR